MKTIDKIAWILLKNNAILSTKSYGKSKFYIPGGKREANETDAETLIREINEELGVTIDENTIQFFGVFEAQADAHPEGTLVKMTCYTADFIGELKANSEIEEIKWLDYSDREKISEVDQLIFDDLKHENLIQ